MSEITFPTSPRQQVSGLVYVARMFDKVRLHAKGELDAAYHANLGTSFDAYVCELVGLSYEVIYKRVLEGGSDEEVLAWCFAQGLQPSAGQIEVWNGFMSKYGWRDDVSDRLVQRKAANGLADRDDVQCFFDFLDADEGRLQRPA